MATPTNSIDLKFCTIKLVDGTTPTANTLTIHIDEGNIQWTRKRNIELKKDRGRLSYTREGDEEGLEVNLECRFNELISSSGDEVSPYEFLEKTGQASAFVSTNPPCEPDATDIFVYIDHPCGTSIEDEIHQFSKFCFTELGGDYRAGTISIKGVCNTLRVIATKSTFP